MDELEFKVAGCGHIITPYNLGGNCSRCDKLCCRDCLTIIDDEMLCPSCLKDRIKG